jgi:hypothetical protein
VGWNIVCEKVTVGTSKGSVKGHTISALTGETVYIEVQFDSPVDVPYHLGLYNEDKGYVQTACSEVSQRKLFRCDYHSDDPTTLHLSLGILKDWLPPPVWKSQPYTITWK